MVHSLLEGATAYVGFDALKGSIANYFLCDGAADNVEVLAALTYAAALGGSDKKKVVLDGDFTFAATVLVPSNVWIEIHGRLYENTDIGGFFEINDVQDVEISGGLMESADSTSSTGILIDGTVGTTSTNIFIHDIKFKELSYGIEVADYTSDVIISNLHGIDCIFVLATLQDTTGIFNFVIDNIISERDDDEARYAVSIDVGASYFTINNVTAYQCGSVNIASSRHITVSNTTSIDFPDGARPSFNIETTPTFQTTQDIIVSNAIVYNSTSVGFRVGVVSATLEDVKLSNCMVYTSGDNGFELTNLKGGLFVNCETLDAGASGFNIFGVSPSYEVEDTQFVNCKADNATDDAWYLTGDIVGFVELHGCVGINSRDGVRLQADLDGARIIDGRYEDNSGYGINIVAATVLNTIVKQNRLSGNGTASLLDAGTGTVTHEIYSYVKDADGNIGQHPTKVMADDTDTLIYNQISLPMEFQQLVTCQVIVVSAASGDMVWTTNTDFGGLCATEDYNTHSDTGGDTTTVTLNDFECIDVSAAFTGVAAGDLVGILFTRDGDAGGDTIDDTVYYLGIRTRYV